MRISKACEETVDGESGWGESSWLDDGLETSDMPGEIWGQPGC